MNDEPISYEPTSYQEDREVIKNKQKNMRYSEIKQQLEQKFEHVTELDKLPTVEHIWVDRGVVLSCEGAAHENHRVFRRVM